jgi:hypothetical protein
MGQPRRECVVTSCAAAILAGLMITGCGTSRATEPSTPTPGQPVPPAAIHRLTAIARRAAKENGDLVPVWATVVVTTHAKALTSATPGDIVAGEQHTIVYLLTMKGHFVAYLASPPAGAKLPTGKYLSIVVDAKTFQGMDAGLSYRPPPVSPASLGPVTQLHLATHMAR